MSWVAAAIGGSALLGAGVSLYGASKASDAQAGASANALAFQQAQNDRIQANIQPFINAGGVALGRLGESYLNPGSVTANPDYMFGFNQGRTALENSAAARGGLISGNFARGITQFGQDYGTNYLTKYRAGLTDIARLGAGAATGGGAIGTQAAGQIGTSFGNIGAAEASGFVGGANAVTGSLGGGVNNYLLYNALNKSSFTPNAGASVSPYNAGWNGNGSVGSAF